MDADDYDVIVVGSGFGGSAAALRLTEKGYRVAVLESGRRFDEETFPETSWRLRSFFWAPRLGLFGIQRLSLLRNVMVLSGAGVGGGSLVYANTLYEPFPSFFEDETWRDITDWRDELAPFYDQAKRMLGMVPNPTMTPADEVMLAVAKEMGVAETFVPTPVGVFFGEPGVEVSDPYFGGVGPARKGCTQCGECMTGCRHGAKNTLLKNYLHLAEGAGAEIHPLTTVTGLLPRADGRYDVTTERTGTWTGKGRRTFVATDVVLGAGTLGTQKLLHAMHDTGTLPNLSPRLGELTRSNSEAILGARTFRRDCDFTRGVAITSSFLPDPQTHVEPVRYGRGSNAMGLLATALADGGGRSRLLTWAVEVLRHPVMMGRTELASLVGADDRRSRHATPRQLPDVLPDLRAIRSSTDLQAGTRRAEPDLDPDRARGGAPPGEAHRRLRRRRLERRLQCSDDGPPHRWGGHR